MKAAAKRTAQAVAAQSVQEWFDALIGDFDAVNGNHAFGDGGFLPDVDLDAVKAAIRSSDGDGFFPDLEEAERDQLAETKAAYLIGVQVGLRLRGGAR